MSFPEKFLQGFDLRILGEVRRGMRSDSLDLQVEFVDTTWINV